MRADLRVGADGQRPCGRAGPAHHFSLPGGVVDNAPQLQVERADGVFYFLFLLIFENKKVVSATLTMSVEARLKLITMALSVSRLRALLFSCSQQQNCCRDAGHHLNSSARASSSSSM